MEKLSGLVLDVYDDVNGAVMKDLYPTLDEVPEVVKCAHQLSPEERDALPSHVFALELRDGDVALRKYACIDEGNTRLNVEYFMKTAHKLPAAAQKVAANNLMVACSWYGIEPSEDLQKVAMGLATMLIAPSIAKGTAEKVKSNLAVARASGNAVNPGALSAQSFGGRSPGLGALPR